MSKRKLVEYTRKGLIYLFATTLCVIYITIFLEPLLGIGVSILFILHELGHAIVAKYYNNFDCFIIKENPGVRRKRVSETLYEEFCVKISGLVLSLFVLPIVFYIGATVYILVTLFFCCVVGASADIIRMIKICMISAYDKDFKGVQQ